MAEKTPGPIGQLAGLAGNWEGSTRTWFEPGQTPEESAARGSFSVLAGGGALLHQYEGTLMGEPQVGMAFFAFDAGAKECQMAWVDNCHTGRKIMFSTQAYSDGLFSARGSYPDPCGGPDWGWRTELEFGGGDEAVVRHYNITPAGAESLAVETRYQRKK